MGRWIAVGADCSRGVSAGWKWEEETTYVITEAGEFEYDQRGIETCEDCDICELIGVGVRCACARVDVEEDDRRV